MSSSSDYMRKVERCCHDDCLIRETEFCDQYLQMNTMPPSSFQLPLLLLSEQCQADEGLMLGVCRSIIEYSVTAICK